MTIRSTTETANGFGQDYQSQLVFDAPADRIFEALTTTRGLTAWWTPTTGGGLTGDELTFNFGPDARAVMRVDAAEPGGEVSWTCLACHLEDWVGTTVHFELETIQDGLTSVRFRHAGLTPQLECYRDCKSGWDHFLPSLRAYVETGTGNPNQSPADLERREARERLRELTP